MRRKGCGGASPSLRTEWEKISVNLRKMNSKWACWKKTNLTLPWRRARRGSGELLSGQPHLDPLEDDGANCTEERKVIKGSQCGFVLYQPDSLLQWDDWLSGWEESCGCCLSSARPLTLPPVASPMTDWSSTDQASGQRGGLKARTDGLKGL